MFKVAPIQLVICLLLLYSCGNRNNQPENNKLDVSLDSAPGVTLELDGNAEEDILFYNMLLPFDLGMNVYNQNSAFNSNVLNPLTNSTLYNESSKRALAIGVYGADLSYLWGYRQSQQALSYFTTIKKIADDMGIPNEYVAITADKAEMYSDNLDSLVNLARKAYSYYDAYLIKSNEPDLAVLVLLGGWIETMHTSVTLYTQPNSQMACKIISQKYSLTCLLNLLFEHTDNEFIAKHGNELNTLLEEFDRLQNLYFSDNLKVDTVNKSITFSASKKLELSPNEFKQLSELIAAMRKEIIK